MTDQTPAPEPTYEEVVAAEHKDEAETTISPKVLASGLTGIGLTVVVAVLAAVTPDLLEPLGAAGPLVYAAVVALGSVLAGYLKRDPLREV